MADGSAAAVAAPNLRRIEPEHRRTHQKIHRNSRLVGRFEDRFWAPFDRRNRERVMQAAERYERVNRKAGKRYGPLGLVALEVLRELMRVIDFKTGRLEPALQTIMGRLRRSRDAVVRALKALRDHGFLQWLRRYEETGERGVRGPQVKQISNAYRIDIPAAAKRLLGRELREDPPAPEDEEVRKAAMVAELRRMAAEESGLAQVFDKAAAARSERESAGRTESGSRLK